MREGKLVGLALLFAAVAAAGSVQASELRVANELNQRGPASPPEMPPPPPPPPPSK